MNTPEFYSQHPGDIPLTYNLPTGEESYVLTFDAINQQVTYSLRYVVVHSCAITLSLVLFLLLLLFISQKRTPVFILNQVILVMVIIRSSLYLAYQFGPLSSLTTVFTGILKEEDYDKYKVSVAANSALIVLIFLIQTSFTYQTFIIFKSPEMKVFRYIITSFSTVFQFVTFGFYINTAVVLTKQYKSMFQNEPFIYGSWVTNLPSILFSVSVTVMSLLLVVKLVCAIRTRKYLGLKQFLSYHILLIMFAQSMFVPAILTIVLHAFPERNGIFNDVGVSLTAAFLPFTTLWASLANNTRKRTSSTLILTESDSSSCNSPKYGKYSDNFTDDGSVHDDNYAFFPQKLQKLNSESATSQLTGSTIKPDDISRPEAFDNLSEKLIPNDILQILRDENDDIYNKHISTVSVESIDVITDKVESLKVFNQIT